MEKKEEKRKLELKVKCQEEKRQCKEEATCGEEATWEEKMKQLESNHAQMSSLSKSEWHKFLYSTCYNSY